MKVRYCNKNLSPKIRLLPDIRQSSLLNFFYGNSAAEENFNNYIISTEENMIPGQEEIARHVGPYTTHQAG